MKGRKHFKPPILADHFFKWYCNERLQETILGDLHEQFHHNVETKGVIRSRLIYWLMVFRFINRFTLARDKNKETSYSNFYTMLSNYLLITFRNLRKNKVFTAINSLGLAVGIASCMIIFFFVRHELTVDQFHTNYENIYRITNSFERSSGTIHWARTPPALAPALRNTITGIDKVTRLRYAGENNISVNEVVFRQENVFYADSVFLEIFDFSLISGDPASALREPNSIVITESMATKYFGSDDPLGKIMVFGDDQPLKVTGVMKDVPTNSHITFDMLISFETFVVPDGYLADLTSWHWAGFHTYLQLSPNAEPGMVNQQIVDLYNQHINRNNISTSTTLQPLGEIYLQSGKYTNVGDCIRTGNETTIYGLSIVAVLILVMASFNFMNLSTALSLGRGKEIGIRKVMGAAKSGIRGQFLTESMVVALISYTVALVIIWLSRSYFQNNLGINWPASDALISLTVIFGIGSLVIGIISGAYPSVVLSSFSPVVALRENLKTGKSGAYIRNTLMVLQFSISVLLIACSLIAVQQVTYINNKSLGFDKENILELKMSREVLGKHYTSLKNRFRQHPEVMEVAISTHAFDGESASGPAALVGAPEGQATQLAYYQTDHDFLKLSNIRLKDGRFFSKDFPTDSSAMVMNETAVTLMELDEPIGTKINFAGRERTVIGVVNDFHFNSLHSDIGPMAIIMPFTNLDKMLVKVDGGDMLSTLKTLEADWREIVGSDPFDVTFLDDRLDSMYQQEHTLVKLMRISSVLAVILACMGLYGLVAFAVQSRLKEVGIRKVLGATVVQLFILLSKRFIQLISVATLISWPVIYLVSSNWLESFAYRINMPWWIYVISGVMLVLISLITISHQALKATLVNPTKILRDE